MPIGGTIYLHVRKAADIIRQASKYPRISAYVYDVRGAKSTRGLGSFLCSNVMPIGGSIYLAAYIIRKLPRPLPTGATFLDRIMTVQETLQAR
jgi:hypothetical protein